MAEPGYWANIIQRELLTMYYVYADPDGNPEVATEKRPNRILLYKSISKNAAERRVEKREEGTNECSGINERDCLGYPREIR